MPPAEFVGDGVTSGPSLIAGFGLFTGGSLAAGEVVLRFDGAPAHAQDLVEINHSCDPNLGFVDDRTLVARREITAHEELTVDYATAVADGDFVLFCHCETYRCRQVVEGTDWQIPQLQQRYAGWWTPALQALIDTGDRQPG
ncbi:SET domain-containing protein-lysine N-methyltransferase [uncultured Jatrophihabitans sp.]|uniref:SET domain-containing protein-lysine N-methyltransferase n=1 Tax=uncultured Jatrophihabitans sp. TaxID=1610747 RepID=UPI0035CB9427